MRATLPLPEDDDDMRSSLAGGGDDNYKINQITLISRININLGSKMT